MVVNRCKNLWWWEKIPKAAHRVKTSVGAGTSVTAVNFSYLGCNLFAEM